MQAKRQIIREADLQRAPKQYVDCSLPRYFRYEICPTPGEGTVAQRNTATTVDEGGDLLAALYLEAD